MPAGIGYGPKSLLPIPPDQADDSLLEDMGLSPSAPMMPPMPPMAAGGDQTGGAVAPGISPDASLFDTQGPNLAGGSVGAPVPMGVPPGAPGAGAPQQDPAEMARMFVERMLASGGMGGQ